MLVRCRAWYGVTFVIYARVTCAGVRFNFISAVDLGERLVAPRAEYQRGAARNRISVTASKSARRSAFVSQSLNCRRAGTIYGPPSG